MSPALLLPVLLLSILSLLCVPVDAVPENLTIDDTNTNYFTWVEGPIQFPAPNPVWAAASSSNPCGYCSARPDLGNATAVHDQTWHDGRVGATASLTFRGSDVFIYGIDLFNSANISFTMDGVASSHQYLGTSEYVFNALFFAARNLALGVNHTVSWVLTETSTNGSSALFDYAVITVDASAGSSSSSASSPTPTTGSPNSSAPRAARNHSKVGPIVGGVLGGLALVCLAAFFLLSWRRKRSIRSAAEGTTPAPRAMGVVEPFTSVASESADQQGSKTFNVAWNTPAPLSTGSRPTQTTNSIPTQTVQTAESAPVQPGSILAARDSDRFTLPPPYNQS
ncbi:hypothetical protein DFH09DRAFT_1144662 [Mycena vulgaris]|nr:hypothetical protein DFH09DRAFT_1144662 [Mycena vulgaris]